MGRSVPGVPMKLRTVFLLLACACSTGLGAAEESAETRAARYYAEGLEPALLQIRTGAVLIQACKDRLRKACAEEQVQLAARNQVLALLDALTLFPRRLAADPTAGVTKPSELRRKISETSAALMRDAGQYDRQVFARYGGALFACPPEQDLDVYLESLNALLLVDLLKFQGLKPGDVKAAMIDHTESVQHEGKRWRNLPSEDCLAARRLGEYLMQLMNSKLRPWTAPEATVNTQREFDFGKPRKDELPSAEQIAQDRELAHAVAGNFVSVFATELQLMVFPESGARIKQIAAENGFPAEG
jgi:hypothetical protein